MKRGNTTPTLSKDVAGVIMTHTRILRETKLVLNAQLLQKVLPPGLIIEDLRMYLTAKQVRKI